VASFTPRSLYPRKRRYCYQMKWGLGETQNRCPLRESNNDSSVVYPVVWLLIQYDTVDSTRTVVHHAVRTIQYDTVDSTRTVVHHAVRTIQ
jgi:hypothetical protein